MARLQCALFGAAVLAGLAGSGGAAFAADDGYENVFSSVLTAVGLLKADESPEIDYRERAPLVLPPKQDLQKPLPAGSARTAAWPQDPDVLRRRKEAEEARAPLRNILGNTNDVISKDELLKGRVAGSADAPESARRHDRCGHQANQPGCLVLSPDQLREEDARFEAAGGAASRKKELVAGQEPDRMYLTQPPHGYLKTTKTVKATEEAPKGYVDNANPSAALVYRKKEDE